ncbi:MAG: RCC1 domain-containing protein [Sandaracinaceae bacterium]
MRKGTMRALRGCAVAALMIACDGGSGTDAGNMGFDAGPMVRFDAGPLRDAGPGGGTDAGPGMTDAGPDAGPGMTDAGPGNTDGGGGMDSGMMMTDAGTDAGAPDAGAPDAGPPALAVVEYAGGRVSSCALLNDGSVKCWGLNDIGQTSEPMASSSTCLDRDGVTSLPCTPLPRTVVGLTGITHISSGGDHTCALDSTGAVYCWGYNAIGQLGRGSNDDLAHPAPAAVVLPGAATQIVAGRFHSCAIVGSGATSTVYCWGLNNQGQLGSPTTGGTCTVGGSPVACRTTPAQVAGLTGVAQVVAGRGHTCARLSTGGVRCWGGNESGHLGIGTTDTAAHTSPEIVSITGVTRLGAGNEHTCAVLSSGTLSCWGQNDAGQLGTGSTTLSTCTLGTDTVPCALTPTAVAGLTGVTQVDGGDFFTCAVHGASAQSCWGVDTTSQLGQPGASIDCGGFNCARSPVLVTAATAVTTMSAGGSHVLSRTGGGPRAWGDNIMRQCGIGSAAATVNAPAAIMMLP